MSPPLVSIIIVNWNGKADTLECLASLAADVYPNKEIIVVDNGSGDDSVAVIRGAFPAVRVIEAGENLGFTGGNNVGLRDALARRPDYIYFLNNDTISQPDAVSELVVAAEQNPAFGLLAPVAHYFDRPDEIWFGGARINVDRGVATHDNSDPPAPGDPLREIPWCTGCAMFLRAPLCGQLGGFDERYFLIYEDVDLSMRVRATGAKIGLVPAARICHKVGRSLGRVSQAASYYSLRNRLLFMRERSGRGTLGAGLAAAGHLWGGLRAARQSGTSALGGLKPGACAIRDYLLGRHGPAPKKGAAAGPVPRSARRGGGPCL